MTPTPQQIEAARALVNTIDQMLRQKNVMMNDIDMFLAKSLADCERRVWLEAAKLIEDEWEQPGECWLANKCRARASEPT